ncbi:MAG: Fe-S cluster assembly protein SufD, partial [Bacteroidia bacterium]
MNTLAEERSLLEDKLLTGFAAFESRLNGEAATPLHAVRRDAVKVLKNIGFPTTKHEDWRYTNFAPQLKKAWNEISADSHISIDQKMLSTLLPEGFDANLVVLVDGFWNDELSFIKEADSNIIIAPFSQAIKSHKSLVENHFAKYADYTHNGFAAANTAYARQGVFIYVPRGKKMSLPVHVLYISGANEKPFVQLRNLIVAEESAEVTVVENYQSVGDGESFLNVVTEISAAPNANVEHYKIQLENNQANHVNLTQIHQQKDSTVRNFTVALGGNILRNDLNYTLDDQNCEAYLNGLYVSADSQLIDNHSFVDHAKPNCYSNEFYKGIMMHKSTAVFNGKIMVRPDAQKTNAYQSNKNILLSPEAKINAKPQLEIFADDVKCSHGATTGQLDEEALFYMRSRGIGEE